MKKILTCMAMSAMLFMACNEESETASNDFNQEVDMSDFYVFTDDTSNENLAQKVSEENKNRNCLTMNRLNENLEKNPGLYKKMYDIEYNTRTFIASKKPDGVGNGNGNDGGTDDGGGETPVDDGLGTITIPVYIYVIYSNTLQNISDAQINSQMTVLNDDFNDTDFSDVRAEFQDLGADVDIYFDLKVVDRQYNSTTDWGLNDAVKSAYPAVSGYLTMWVAPISAGYLGYAQFPGGDPSTDGVVMSPQYFGSSDYDTQGNFYLSAPFDLGRTTTHEVGHWLNLRHIWGDGRCNQDDFVDDTPSSDGANYSCDLTEVSCRSTDMVENYMDYSDDGCMGIFTIGQKERMRANFVAGGAREDLPL